MSFWFANVLVHHPYIILISVAVFSSTCVIIPFTLKTLPDFSDPQSGFETRGTILAGRRTAWKNLIEATRPSGPFAVNPKEFLMSKKNKSLYMKPKQKKGLNKKKKIKELLQIGWYDKEERNDTKLDTIAQLRELLHSNNSVPVRARSKKEGFFCSPPAENYVHMVVKSKNGVDLFSLDSLLRMCQIEQEFIQARFYKDLCLTNKKQKCCRPWSLANYIALLQNRTSCLALTEEDVNNTRTLLKFCAPYYYELKLASDCQQHHCQAPPECQRHNAVYNIINYLMSTSYLSPNSSEDGKILEESMIFLPVACSSATLPYYHNIERLKLDFDELSVVAMDFGIKDALFDECLLTDTWLMFCGSVFVMLCISLYTKSLFLTLMTITAIVFSLGISYFMYTLVFELRFFPFMNLLAIVVVIGIGSDDAFIFCKVWSKSRKDNEKSLVKVMSESIYHAFFSMFVTSITTAAAFLASFVSTITAIRCFSIFASIAVIANCLLMMSWFPACIVIYERLCDQSHWDGVKKSTCAYFQKVCCCKFDHFKLATAKMKMICVSLENIYSVKERSIQESIVTYRYVWFVALSLVALFSAVIVFYYPKLQLPNSSEFQLFHTKHPFEQYDLVYKKKFWFKRAEMSADGESTNAKLPLRFIWGVKPVDTGSYLDPQSHGKLQLDSEFDVSAPESQQWLLNFCQALRRQPFYQSTLGPLLPNCFIESFKSWMERNCKDPIDNIDRNPCCNSQTFPYQRAIFDLCILDAIDDLYSTPAEFFIPGMAGPKFSKDDGPRIKALVVEYDSNYSYSLSYEYMREFITQVEVFAIRQMQTAPVGMRHGFFLSEVQFYDLQMVLSGGSLAAIGFAMGFSLVVLCLSTFNLLTSLCAIFTITCSILVTIGVLVLLGWKLNILESIAVTTAIGLTVDFSLHYTISYRLCPSGMNDDRKSATRFALSNMFAPSLMAAITTGMAGAFMLPSHILPYIQIGILLVTVMTTSWIFATFHLGATLAIIGPERTFGHFDHLAFLCVKCCRSARKNKKSQERQVTEVELESLTAKPTERKRQLQRSLSATKNPSCVFHLSDQSPSATSAITIVVAEDN